MMNSKARQQLFAEAANYADRATYISDLVLSPIWKDAPGADIPPARAELLGIIYDAATATIPGLIEAYGLSQTNFARYFNIPLRTVQDWCSGRRSCPQYLIAMAAEILAKSA